MVKTNNLRIFLDEGALSFKFTKAFEILSGIAKEINSSKVVIRYKMPENIFEPEGRLMRRPIWIDFMLSILPCSPTWIRTTNLEVNSFLLYR